GILTPLPWARVASLMACSTSFTTSRPGSGQLRSANCSGLTWGQHNPEPEIAGPDVRAVVATVRGPTASSGFGPTAAADHAERTRGGPLGVDCTSAGIVTP